MKLKRQEIEHIASLARLELSEEEIKRYENQLSDILSYVGQLQEVNTDNTSPCFQAGEVKNVFREDEVNKWDEEERKKALGEAPELEGNFIKVKRVLE